MIKKILISLAVIVIIVLAGIWIFIATFDINAYRSAIAQSISKIVGNAVEIDHLSLSWKGRIVLGVDGFRVIDQTGGARTIVMSVGHADATIELTSLSGGDVDISSITIIQPKIVVIREKSGSIKVSGVEINKTALQTEGAVAQASMADIEGFNIRSIEIRDGIVGVLDMTTDPASEIAMRKLDADIKNVSMAGPVDFTLKAALASDVQNFEMKGRSGGFVTGEIYIKDMTARFDLGALKKEAFFGAFPALAKAGLTEPPTGEFKTTVRNIEISGGKLGKISADADLAGGKLTLRQVRVPVEDITASLSIEGSEFSIKSFSARMANGKVSASSQSKDIFKSPKTSLKCKLDVQGLGAFILSVTGTKQNIDGDLSLYFEGSMTGITQPEIVSTLAGSGTLSLDNGVIVDTNVMADSLNSLTLFPGMLDIMSGFVPPDVKNSFGEKYTILKPMSRPFTVEGGYIILPDIVFETDVGDMRGDATVSFTGDLSMKGAVEFTDTVSGSIEKAVPQTQYLRNANKLIEFPIAIKSGSGGFRVIPDLKYVGKKIALGGATDAAAGFLNKLAASAEPAQPSN